MLKIFQTKIMKNEEIVYLKWKEINQICSWNRAFRLNKRARLFNKRALGQAKRAGGGRITPNELFLTLLIQIKKKIIFLENDTF